MPTDVTAQLLARRLPTVAPSTTWSTIGALDMVLRGAAVSSDGSRIYNSHGINVGGIVQQTLSIITTAGQRITGPLPLLVRAWTAGVWCNGRHWSIGGGTTNGPSDQVEGYAPAGTNGAAGTWATTTAMPAARIAQSAAAIGSFVYVAGGSSTTTSGEPAASGATNSVYRFNAQIGSSGAWVTMPSLPAARYGGALVAVGTRLYYLGGFDSAGAAATAVYVYDTAQGTAGTWSTAAPLPAGGNAGAVVIGSTIHVVRPSGLGYTSTDGTSWSAAGWAAPVHHGSWSGTVAIGSTVYMVSGTDTANVDAFDVEAAALATVPGWTTRATLPQYRSSAAVSTDGSRIFILHGFRDSNTPVFNTGMIVTPDGTTTFTSQSAEQKWKAAGVWCNGRAWSIGGQPFSASATSQASAWVPSATTGTGGAWADAGNFFTAIYPAAAVIGNTIYVAGGQVDPTTNQAQNLLQSRDTTSASLTGTSLATMPAGRSRGALVAIGTKLYYVGGLDTTGVRQSTVFVYDTTLGTWSTIPYGSGGLGWNTATAIGSVIYAHDAQTGSIASWDTAKSPSLVTWTQFATRNVGSFPALLTMGSNLVIVGGTASFLIEQIDPAAVAAGSGFSRRVKLVQQYMASVDPAALVASRRLPLTAPTAPAWATLGALPATRTAAAVSSDGTRIYASGGAVGGTVTNSMVVVSSAGTVSAGPALPPSVQGAAGVWFNGAHWNIGGLNGTTIIGRADAYTPGGSDGASGTWQQWTTMPGNRCYASAAVLNGILYVVGGQSTQNVSNASNSVYRFNGGTAPGSWTDLTATAPLPAARTQGALLAVNGKLYYIGGRDTTGATQTSAFVYDPVLGTWSTLPMNNGNAGYMAATVIGTTIYAYTSPNGSVSAWDVQARPSEVNFNLVSGVPEHGNFPGMAAIGNAIHVVSGSGTANVDRIDPVSAPNYTRDVRALRAILAA